VPQKPAGSRFQGANRSCDIIGELGNLSPAGICDPSNRHFFTAKK